MIGGKTAEGLAYSVRQSSITDKTKPIDVGEFPAKLAANPANKVTGLKRDNANGMDTVSFAVSGPRSRAFIRTIKTGKALYQMIVEVPNSYRSPLPMSAEEFLASLVIKDH